MKSNPSSRQRAAVGKPAGPDARQTSFAQDIPRIDSAELLGSSGRVVIEHHGQRYELRETRFGKLILTK